jgi:type I restriction enzyme S subunit
MSFYGGLDSKEANSSLQSYEINDILLGAMRVYSPRVCIAAQKGITRSTTLVLRPYNSNYMPFLYELINQDETIQYASKISVGTQQPYVNWNDSLSDYSVIVPEEKYILEFSRIIRPIIDKVFTLVKENYELSQLRDFLLPLLMNGQVVVGK